MFVGRGYRGKVIFGGEVALTTGREECGKDMLAAWRDIYQERGRYSLTFNGPYAVTEDFPEYFVLEANLPGTVRIFFKHHELTDKERKRETLFLAHGTYGNAEEVVGDFLETLGLELDPQKPEWLVDDVERMARYIAQQERGEQ